MGLIYLKETVTFRSTALIFIVSPLFAYESYTLKSTSNLRNHNNVSFMIVLIPKQSSANHKNGWHFKSPDIFRFVRLTSLHVSDWTILSQLLCI